MSRQETFAIIIAMTSLASIINYKFVKLPKSIGLTFITLIICMITAFSGRLGWDVEGFASALLKGICFDQTFLHGMLSFLLFAGALHVNTIELARHKMLIFLLATVSVVISTFLIGYATYAVTSLLGIAIPRSYCFVFGALISPTDPIAVLGILKKVCAPKSLEIKIAGEALFNDGMGIVLFFITLGLAQGQGTQDLVLSPISLLLTFIQFGIGGLVLGAILGWASAKLLESIHDYEVSILLTLSVVTVGYSLAESVFNVSGPICIAVAGLVIGDSCKKGLASGRTLKYLDNFWSIIDEILNAVLFVVIGLEIFSIHPSFMTMLVGIASIMITIAARAISVMIPVSIMSISKRFNPEIITIMTWGGLRGGISIALALSINQGPYRDFIVSITYFVVLFSILVQGLSIGHLIKVLLDKKTTTQRVQSSQAPLGRESLLPTLTQNMVQ